MDQDQENADEWKEGHGSIRFQVRGEGGGKNSVPRIVVMKELPVEHKGLKEPGDFKTLVLSLIVSRKQTGLTTLDQRKVRNDRIVVYAEAVMALEELSM